MIGLEMRAKCVDHCTVITALKVNIYKLIKYDRYLLDHKEGEFWPVGWSANFLMMATSLLSVMWGGIFLKQSLVGLTNMLRFFNIDRLYFSSLVGFSKSVLDTPYGKTLIIPTSFHWKFLVWEQKMSMIRVTFIVSSFKY